MAGDMAGDFASETCEEMIYDSMIPKSVVDTRVLVSFYLTLLLFGSSFLLIFLHVVLPSYGLLLYQ